MAAQVAPSDRLQLPVAHDDPRRHVVTAFLAA
jgi:hypothetical protein